MPDIGAVRPRTTSPDRQATLCPIRSETGELPLGLANLDLTRAPHQRSQVPLGHHPFWGASRQATDVVEDARIELQASLKRSRLIGE